MNKKYILSLITILIVIISFIVVYNLLTPIKEDVKINVWDVKINPNQLSYHVTVYNENWLDKNLSGHFTYIDIPNQDVYISNYTMLTVPKGVTFFNWKYIL